MDLENLISKTKRVLRKPLIYTTLASMPFLFSCEEPEKEDSYQTTTQTTKPSSDNQDNEGSEENKENPSQEPSNHVFDQELTDNIYRVSDDEIYFNSPPQELSSLKEGDFLISDISEGTPNGLLKRVISFTDDKRVINVVQAYPQEIEKEGSLEVNYNLKPKLEKSISVEGLLKSISDKKGFDFAYSFDKVLYDEDKFSGTTEDQTRIKGEIYFNSSIDIDMKIKDHKLNHFSFINNLNQNSSLEVVSKTSYKFPSSEQPIFEIPFNPVTVGFVGIVPIVEGHEEV